MRSEADYEAIRTPVRAALLEKRVLAALRPALGRRLARVRYSCHAGECEVEDLGDPDLAFGGELDLAFHGGPRVVVAADESAGWDATWSIQAREDSASASGTLREFDANDLPSWRNVVGRELELVRVHGKEGVPHVLELRFENGTVLLADGEGERVGDGDELLVRKGRRPGVLAGCAKMATLKRG